jgi:hypothetical protein
LSDQAASIIRDYFSGGLYRQITFIYEGKKIGSVGDGVLFFELSVKNDGKIFFRIDTNIAARDFFRYSSIFS